MPEAQGFALTRRKNGDIVITHHGRPATVLRDKRAIEFVTNVATGDQQELMARLTGNYKRGNERHARTHQRHR